MASFREALIRAVADAVDRVFAEHLGTAAPATKAKGPKTHRAGKKAGPITKWTPGKRARRVPLFVIKATGIKTKQGVLKRWDASAVFLAGKPLPPEKKASKAKAKSPPGAKLAGGPR
jgi:hypothetical protein